ncbi:MAG: hypothetical protein COA78_06930 [Blastopirellula sp.]|nr:MAG: hypothetical protein COA78_06930 [Blastopirellula sp.]
MADIPAITEIPPAPARTDPPAIFVPKADLFMAALPGLGTELNAAIAQMNINTAIVDLAVASTTANAGIASAAANVLIWVSNETYLIGAIHFSPLNFLNYRAITNHDTVATDPSVDSTNWKIHDASTAAQIADASPLTTTTHDFDYADGGMQKIQAPNGGSLTLSFSNMPTGVLSAFIFQIEDGGDCAISFPAGTKHPDTIPLTFTEAGVDMCAAWKDSSGTLVVGIGLKAIGVPA